MKNVILIKNLNFMWEIFTPEGYGIRVTALVRQSIQKYAAYYTNFNFILRYVNFILSDKKYWFS